MPTKEELENALRKADQLGNVSDAKRIAAEIRKLDSLTNKDITANTIGKGITVPPVTTSPVTTPPPSNVPTQPKDDRYVPEWGQKNPRLYGAAGALTEVLRPLAEFGGLAGGSVIGAGTGGPVGAVTGGTLGYAGGKELTNIADRFLGNKPPSSSVADELRRVGGNIKEGAMLEAGGQVAGPILGTGYQKVVKPTLEATGKGISEVAGLITGTGGKTYRQLADAAREGGTRLEIALNNLRGGEPLESVVVEANAALRSMHKARTDMYLTDMAKLSESKTVLNFKDIDDAFKSILKEFKIGNTWTVSKSTVNKVKEVQEAILQWKNGPKELRTTVGFDKLKQLIGDLRPDKLDATKASYVVDKMYDAIRKTIIRESPEYAKIMKEFESSISVTKQIEKVLSLGRDITKQEAALRKLQSVLKDNVNTTWGGRENLAKLLEEQGGANILDRIAGQTGSAWTPRGGFANVPPGLAAIGALTGFVNPVALSGALLTSPRLVSELAVKGGQTAGRITKATTPERSARIGQAAYYPFIDENETVNQLRNGGLTR